VDNLLPHFQPMPLRCAHCDHRWTDYFAVDCHLTVAVAVMKAVAEHGCPSCHRNDDRAVLIETGDPGREGDAPP
jgi:hypothetical protein